MFPSPAQDYELQADTYRCSLEPTLAVSAPKRLRVVPLQESVQAQVRQALGLSRPSLELCCLCWLELTLFLHPVCPLRRRTLPKPTQRLQPRSSSS